MTTTTLRNILSGPSREDLFDALRLRHEGKQVTFTVAPETQPPANARVKFHDLTFKAQVNQLGIEDGSGNNWVFKLYDRHGVLGSQYLEGYMNTTRRTGWVRPATR